MTPRRFLVRAAPLLALAAAGIVVIALGKDDSTALIVGGGIEALAGVLLMALLFWEVGRSEDRAREAEQRERRR